MAIAVAGGVVNRDDRIGVIIPGGVHRTSSPFSPRTCLLLFLPSVRAALVRGRFSCFTKRLIRHSTTRADKV